MGFLRLHLQSSASTNSPPCRSAPSLLSILSRGGTIFPMCTDFSLESVPADVALVSPQTPLIPPNHPLLVGGYSKAISLESSTAYEFSVGFLRRTLQHTPQQTLHPVAPLLPSSQAFREEGPTSRYIRVYRSDTRPDPTGFNPTYTCFSFVL